MALTVRYVGGGGGGQKVLDYNLLGLRNQATDTDHTIMIITDQTKVTDSPDAVSVSLA